MEQITERQERIAEKELAGKVAIVTGGGRGLGEAVCRTLADGGASVVVADLDAGRARAVAASLPDETRALGIPVDVTQEEQVRNAISHVLGRYGRIDIVVNNAGVNVTESIERLSIADWDRILAVNLRAPFLMSKIAFPYMRKRAGGAIVNIVSTAAKRAWANAAAYHASKWGLLGFSHALHVEARKFNIKVTAVIAGGMRTPFLLEPFPDIDVTTLQAPENVALTIRRILSLPMETVVPEIMILPMKETSWP